MALNDRGPRRPTTKQEQEKEDRMFRAEKAQHAGRVERKFSRARHVRAERRKNGQKSVKYY